MVAVQGSDVVLDYLPDHGRQVVGHSLHVEEPRHVGKELRQRRKEDEDWVAEGDQPCSLVNVLHQHFDLGVVLVEVLAGQHAPESVHDRHVELPPQVDRPVVVLGEKLGELDVFVLLLKN